MVSGQSAHDPARRRELVGKASGAGTRPLRIQIHRKWSLDTQPRCRRECAEYSWLPQFGRGGPTMKAQFKSVQRRMCRKPPLQARVDSRPKAQPRDRHEETIQLIYAHLPPAVVLAPEQYLRAQTHIEQWAHQFGL